MDLAAYRLGPLKKARQGQKDENITECNWRPYKRGRAPGDGGLMQKKGPMRNHQEDGGIKAKERP